MAVTVGELAALCEAGGLRHHLDAEEGVIRVVLVTRWYCNARGERLAILRIEAADRGMRLRVMLDRAFATEGNPAAVCLAVCEATGDVPCVRLEHDALSHSLRLAAEMPVEDAHVSARQLFALIDHVVAAAEAGQRALASRAGESESSPGRAA